MRLVQRGLVLASAGTLTMVMMAACAQQPAAPAEPAMTPEQIAAAQVEHGRLLIAGGGCHDCHSPKVFESGAPEPDMTRALSGHPESAGVPEPFKPIPGSPWTTHTNDHLTAWSGAWGVSFAANLTPDNNTGIYTYRFLRQLGEAEGDLRAIEFGR